MNTNYESMLQGFIVQGEQFFKNKSYLAGLVDVKRRISAILTKFEDRMEQLRKEFAASRITQLVKNEQASEARLQAIDDLDTIKDLSEMLRTMESKFYDEIKLTGSALVVQTLLMQEVRSYLRTLDPLQLDSLVQTELARGESSIYLDALVSSPLPIITVEQAKAYQRQRGLARHPEMEADIADVELSIGLVQGLKQFAHSIVQG